MDEQTGGGPVGLPGVRIGTKGRIQLTPREHTGALQLEANQDWLVTGVDGATGEGRAGVVIGLRLPNGRWALQLTTLRTFFSAAKALVALHGEGWMQDELGMRFETDRELRLAIALRSVSAQLLGLQARCGLAPAVSMVAGDEQYARVAEVLAAARSVVAVDAEHGRGPQDAATNALGSALDRLKAAVRALRKSDDETESTKPE